MCSGRLCIRQNLELWLALGSHTSLSAGKNQFISDVKIMKASLTKQQSTELLDNIGKMLTTELEAEPVKNKVKSLISDYIKKNKIDEDPKTLANKVKLSVKVSLA